MREPLLRRHDARCPRRAGGTVPATSASTSDGHPHSPLSGPNQLLSSSCRNLLSRPRCTRSRSRTRASPHSQQGGLGTHGRKNCTHPSPRAICNLRNPPCPRSSPQFPGQRRQGHQRAPANSARTGDGTLSMRAHSTLSPHGRQTAWWRTQQSSLRARRRPWRRWIPVGSAGAKGRFCSRACEQGATGASRLGRIWTRRECRPGCARWGGVNVVPPHGRTFTLLRPRGRKSCTGRCSLLPARVGDAWRRRHGGINLKP